MNREDYHVWGADYETPPRRVYQEGMQYLWEAFLAGDTDHFVIEVPS